MGIKSIESFDALVKETREAVAKADESWKTKTVKITVNLKQKHML